MKREMHECIERLEENRQLMIHQNEDGSFQLRDNLSRFWCACGNPAISYISALEGTPYAFKCMKCAKEDGDITEKKYHYTEAVLKAIAKNRDDFEDMLQSIVESPYQNEYGDVWVTKELASSVCSELLHMCIDGKMMASTYGIDFKQIAAKEDDELLDIYG